MMLPRGFSSNLVLLLWLYFGGVLLWACEGNILALMFKKVYEDPVDTVEDVIAKKLIPVLDPGQSIYVDLLAQSAGKLYQDLASITVVAEDWAELV